MYLILPFTTLIYFLKLVKIVKLTRSWKNLLFCYFDLSSSFKSFSSFYTRHCKRALVHVMAVFFLFFFLFGQMIRCEVEQTSEDFIGPGNKLADNLTHLTTGKAMKPLRHWFRSTPCLQDFFCFVFVKSTKYGVFVSLDACLLTHGFYLPSLISLCLLCNICFVALQETEMEKLQKMTKVKIYYIQL